MTVSSAAQSMGLGLTDYKGYIQSRQNSHEGKLLGLVDGF